MDPYERRVQRVQNWLQSENGDCLILPSSPNLYYLMGYASKPSEDALLLFVPPEGRPVFLKPDHYSQLGNDTWTPEIRTYGRDNDAMTYAVEIANELGVADGEILLGKRTWAEFAIRIQQALPNATFDLAGDVLIDSRTRKDRREKESLRDGARLTDRISREIRQLGADVVGLTERELAYEIARRLDRDGGGELPFDVQVASGPNGAKPRHFTSDRTIGSGDPVILDFGTRIDTYVNDQSRTVVFDGDPPDGFRSAFDAVRDSLQTTVDAVGPGVRVDEIYDLSRNVLEKHGYGEYVDQRGHGVGLELTEPPDLAANNERTLEEGMAFTVEPGLYFEGEFGIRLENTVLVTEEGSESLNDSPLGWRA